MRGEGTQHGRAVRVYVRTYVRALRRRRWAVLTAIVVVPAVAAAVSLSEQDRYRASAAVVLTYPSILPTLTGVNSSLVKRLSADTQAAQSNAGRLAKRALAATHADRSAAELLNSLGVSANEVDTFEFSVSDRDRTTAVRLAEAFAAQFAAYRNALDRPALQDARRAVQMQLRALSANGRARGRLYGRLVETRRRLLTLEGSASVAYPTSEAEHIWPRPKRDVLVGLLLGIVVGSVVALLADILRSVDEIAERLDLPLPKRLRNRTRRLRGDDGFAMLAGRRYGTSTGGHGSFGQYFRARPRAARLGEADSWKQT